MMPWERDWNVVSQEQSANKIMPWMKEWFITRTPSQKDSNKESPDIDTVFNRLIQAESKGQHVDPSTGELITSKAGAEGITQLMPKTAAKPGFGIEPIKDKSESEYLRVGRQYLSALYGRLGDWEKTLAAYNSGLGNVRKAEGMADRFGGDWKDYLPKKGETLPYIQKILGKNQYGEKR